jgi:outer membrane protein assembly factor BamA
MHGTPKVRPKVHFGRFVLGFFCWVGTAGAQSLSVSTLPVVRPAMEDLSALSGKPITSVDVVSTGRWFKESSSLGWVKPGDPFSVAELRSSVRDLLERGHYATADIEATPEGDGVRVRVLVDPRRIIAAVQVFGAAFPVDEVLEQTGIKIGTEIADSEVTVKREAIRAFHVQRGYPNAKVELKALTTEDPLGVVFIVMVQPGLPVVVGRRRFEVAPSPDSPGLKTVLSTYAVSVKDRYDEPSLFRADRGLLQTLRHKGWHEATVTHSAKVTEGIVEVRVRVHAGPKVLIAFEGNDTFDADRLNDVLELETNEDRSVEGMAERLRKHYTGYGFFDVRVTPRVDASGSVVRRVTFSIAEGQVIRVTRRTYPCLTGERTADEVSAEIDSFLAEELPGADLLGPVDPKTIDASIGPTAPTGARPEPLKSNPYETYSPRVYERAMKHVQDLYRSEGYLSATVGPPRLKRRRCAVGSPPGQCRPLESTAKDDTSCLLDDQGLPLDEPVMNPELGCNADPKRGYYCDTALVLELPIKLGPRTTLWDVSFEGNRRLTDARLGGVAELKLGEPLSLAEVEQARRRVLDEYTERGFAYADVTVQVEPSPDHSRARVRFSVREGEQVKVGAIFVKGAQITSEALIRTRIALEVGKPYRHSWVRATEERLGSLGVFSTVRVGLEDPYVPAREKNVIIEVTERVPQYFEAQPGFSTGEGARVRFEFGHLNVGGKAVQFALRARLSYLPDALIFERDVRAKYEAEVSEVRQRLERTISLSATFPNIGLGPQFRMGAEAFDVHDNARDYTLTKDAAVLNLSHLTTRRLTLQVGGSLERNDVRIFGSGQQDQEGGLENYIKSHPGQSAIFRVPAGTTAAVAERFTVSWDRRDMPFDAHRGTLVTSTLEHVTARPVYENASTSSSPYRAADSDFLHWTSRLAGYIPLSKKGATFALSFRFGLNHQLMSGSNTYPDRLFFMGGMDSVRGFLQDSMIPEDVAHQLLAKKSTTAPESNLEVDEVLIRGGNFFVNPRAEFRFPLFGSSLFSALFIDAGNLWSRSPTEPELTGTAYHPNYFRLRYAFGTGLRYQTPIGPLVIDYGLNAERLLDRLVPSRTKQRTWEELGAFHFSVGVF